MLLPFQGDIICVLFTQGDALGYGLLAFQAVFLPWEGWGGAPYFLNSDLSITTKMVSTTWP